MTMVQNIDGVRIGLTEYDVQRLGEGVRNWIQYLPDPHEFATAFVNWVDKNDPKSPDLFLLHDAVEYWERHETMRGFTSKTERLGGNG